MKRLIPLLGFLSLTLGAQLGFAQFPISQQDQNRSFDRGHDGGGEHSPGSGHQQPGRPSAPRYGDLTPVYRMFNGRDHMMSLNPSEGVQVGYHLEGEMFRVFSTADGGRVPLYRCVARGNDHFASTQANCEGQLTEFLIGYMQSFQNGNAPRAIYRCVTKKDHLITTDTNDCTRNGYKVEGVLGFVP